MTGEGANFCDRKLIFGEIWRNFAFSRTQCKVFSFQPLEHSDEGEDRVEESAGVGHQQLLVTHLQRRHK
jgi:hypothetical protein